MIRTTLKGLAAHKGRLLTTAAAVMLGVAFMAGTLVFTDTIGEQFDSLVADVNAGTDVVVRGETAFTAQSTLNGNGQAVRDRIDDSLVATVATVDGVDAAAGRTSGWVQMVGSDGQAVGGGMEGLRGVGSNWVDDDRLNPFRLAEGSAPAAEDEVVIDRQTATEGALSVGDRTTVLVRGGPTPVEVVGIATFGDADGMFDTSSVLFTTEAAQRLVGTPGKVDEVVAVAVDGLGSDELTERVAAAVPSGTEVLTGAELVAEQQEGVAADLGFFNTFMLTFAVVALFVGAFIIANTFSIIVAQRTRELAVLRAIGASRRQVMASILTESAVVGVVASAAGLVAGVGVASLLRSLMAGLGLDVPGGDLVVTTSSLVIAASVGIVITVVSAVLPARRAARIAPVAAMRSVAVDDSAGSRTRLVAGIAASLVGAALLGTGLAGVGDTPLALVGAGAAVVFLGVAVLSPTLARPVSRFIGAPIARTGLSGTLARQNAMRSPKRTAATASALMVGVALVALISILAGSVKASIDDSVNGTVRAEFVVESGTFGTGGFDPALGAGIAALDEVAATSGLAFADASLDGRASILTALDTDALDEILAVDMDAGSASALGATGVAVTADLAEENGWTVGGTIPAVLSDGATRDLVLRGTFTNRDLGDVVVDRALVDTLDAPPLDSALFIRLAEGVGVEEGRAAISSVTDTVANAQLQDRSEYVEAQAAMVDPLLGLIYALLGLAVLIAVLGIANTLALSIMERVRELGLLRAVGMNRRQVRSMVRWESVIIALYGTVLGMVVGTGFGWAITHALRDDGVSSMAVPVTTLVVVALGAALAGVLAAARPARRAARLDVLTALQAT